MTVSLMVLPTVIAIMILKNDFYVFTIQVDTMHAELDEEHIRTDNSLSPSPSLTSLAASLTLIGSNLVEI